MGKLLTAALAVLTWCGLAQVQGDGWVSAARADAAAGRLAIAEITAMPAGSWLHYGRPWRDIDPGRGDNCGVDFSSLLGAWNGVLWDGRYVWTWAAGGHGDGCFNGIVRYDLQAGRPEMVVPHLPLNMPLLRAYRFDAEDNPSDGWHEPYVSKTPWPACQGLDANCQNLSKAKRLEHGPTIRMDDWPNVAATFGAFLRPRSSHIYNNLVRIGNWIYLLTGQIYGSSKADAQVWRVDVNEPANSIERLPDRWDPDARGGRGDYFGSVGVNWIQRSGQPLLMISASDVCEVDLVAGSYNCSQHAGLYYSGSSTLAWDETRQGIWGIDPNSSRLSLAREVDGQWVFDEALTVTDPDILDKSLIGNAGICVVPTANGTNPVIWGQARDGHPRLIRWDGRELRKISAAGMPRQTGTSVLNKWTWRDDLGVCLGTWSIDEGIWAWKPEFAAQISADGNTQHVGPPPSESREKATEVEKKGSAGEGESADSAAPAGLPSAPTPVLTLERNPLLTGTPQSPQRRTEHEAGQATNRSKRSGEQQELVAKSGEISRVAEPLGRPVHYPRFAGHSVAPAPWRPAAWNEPIERLAEAPDYDALCPGPWAEFHFRTQEDVAASEALLRNTARSGTPNVRVYLHPVIDHSGRVIPYEDRVKFDEVNCAEIVGVPSDGRKPMIADSIVPGHVGIIARGIVLLGGEVAFTGNLSQKRFLKFMVLHEMEMYEKGVLWGVSSADAYPTYVELRGNVFGHNLDWHLFYFERSIGTFVALSNVFFGPGRGYHTLKNLAHSSRLEGNVFSNVGIDGQPLGETGRGKPIVGLFPLDLYGCTETIFRDNTVVFRTDNFVRAFMAYRGRSAWGNCDKGRRLPDGEHWELWAPESKEYHDTAKWAEIAAAVTAFDRGFEAARAEPWLFTHLNEGNTFIVFNAHNGDDDTRPFAAENLRPVADNTLKDAIRAKAREIAQTCENAADRRACFMSNADETITYIYNHISPTQQRSLVEHGMTPNGTPIPPPDGWVERSGVFWGENQFITCTADGTDCRRTAPRPVDAAPRPWDELELAHPPRVIMMQ